MSKSIKLNRRIKAPPEEVFRALTNPFTIELWSGEPAVMSEEPGTEFSMMDGSILGRNLEIETNELLRQAWYFGKEESEVIIRLFPEKENTQIRIEHRNIPDEAYENMLEGWKETYLEQLKDFFEK